MHDRFATLAIIIWQVGAIGTTIFLIVQDWADFNWWNWIFLIPINFFLGEIWPIYWAILRPLFGG